MADTAVLLVVLVETVVVSLILGINGVKVTPVEMILELHQLLKDSLLGVVLLAQDQIVDLSIVVVVEVEHQVQVVVYHTKME